jgi:hypothetical protein
MMVATKEKSGCQYALAAGMQLNPIGSRFGVF